MIQFATKSLFVCAMLALALVACGDSSDDDEPQMPSPVTTVASTTTSAPSFAPVGGACGGAQGIQCVSGVFCNFPVGDCGSGNAFGVCTERPTVCTFDFNPVCGCNGMTYSNACAAASAGFSVRFTGSC